MSDSGVHGHRKDTMEMCLLFSQSVRGRMFPGTVINALLSFGSSGTVWLHLLNRKEVHRSQAERLSSAYLAIFPVRFEHAGSR